MPATTLTRYTWPAGQLVQRLDVRTQSDGRAVAYLYADSTEETREQRQQLRATVRLKGWGTLSDFRDGAYALRISGISNPSELLDLLKQGNSISGEPTIETRAEGPQEKNLLDFVRNHSLRLSGIIYMVGNAFYYMGGRAGKSPDDQRMAISFAAGDGLLGVFGGRDDNRQFRSLVEKLKTHYEKTGIAVPENASMHVEISRKGQSLWAGTKDFMHEHINALKIAAEVVGGYFAFRSGLKRNEAGQQNPYRILGGLVVMAGWTGALLTKERKPDKEKLENASLPEKAVAYIQEKPLRLAGWAGLAFNALTFKGALDNRKTPAGKWNLGAVGAMVSANGLYSISNKTVGGDIKTDAIVGDVYIVAAQILNKQPDGLREQAIESTAKFLGERPEIQGSRTEIVARLREQMEIQRNSPWFEKTPLPAYTPQPKRGKILRAADMAVDAAGSQGSPVPVVQREGAQLASAERLAEHAR